MARFIHTADLHLGLRLTRFEADHAARIRDARFRALEKVLAAVAERKADFLLIAGDLFDDAAVHATTARRAFEILEAGACPVYVLPGNHDPLLPGCVWDRYPWSKRDAARVRLLRTTEPFSAGQGIVLLPCPVLRRTSLDDPTAWIPAGGDRRGSTVRIGIAHGSLKDRDNLPADDHLIDRYAADEHELDYLALGHWHSTREFTDRGGVVRTVYPGVHEPIGFPPNVQKEIGWMPYSGDPEGDDFADDGDGKVLWVEIAGPGAAPKIQRVDVGILKWCSELRRAGSEADLADIIRQTAQRPDPDRTILRLSLEGVLGAAAMLRLDELREVLHGRYVHGELIDESLRLEPSEQEAREIIGHGILKAVFDRLSEQVRPAQETGEGMPITDEARLAERAMMVLYQIAAELKR